ncbi:MAG: DNA polymerase III subunit alpha, partial [Aerococcus viridans]
PLQASSTHIPNTQYTMGDVEAVGLLKVDFLSLSNLTILHEGLAAVGKLTSRPVKALDIPLDDPKTYEIFQHADTNGVFQFESDGIKNVLKQVAPTSIEDVVAVNALYRPGPVQQIPHFVARKHGREAIAYPHPDLAPMLAPTYGVMVYQEQVMQVTQKIAGFSLGEADILRRAIGKKKHETIEKVRKQFISGAIENGYQESVAVQIYDYIEAFANYGFNKSHSFAYSYLAYQLAWIKANYPVAFYYGNLKHTRIYDKKGKNLLLEAKNHGVEVVNPDINKSFYGLSVVDDHQLQLGLGDIRGIPKRAVEEMIQAREAEGPFKDFADFIHRLGKLALKEDILVKLAQAGALDSFGYNRRTLQLEAIPKMIPKIVEIDEFDQHQLIENEIETLGQALSISLFEDYESFYQTGIIDYIENLKENDKAFFIGEVMAVKRITTKKNQPMAFVTLEDQTGQISVTAFPEAYITFAKHLNQGNALLVYGKTQKRNNELQVLLTKAWMLDEDTKAYLNNLSQKQADGSGQADHAGGQKDQLAQSTQAPVCWIRVEDRAKASELKAGLLEVVGKYPGQTRLHFTIVASQENYWLSEKFAIEVTDESVTELIAIYGEGNVVVK